MASMMKVAGVFSKQAREPIQSNGRREGRPHGAPPANHASVIDLGSQTITSIDMQKKQYTVMTFDEMKQMMEQMSQKMKQNDKGEMTSRFRQRHGQDQAGCRFRRQGNGDAMEMEGTDKKSGQKGGMTVTTDMWIAPGVPGYQEVRAFYQRMARENQLDARRQHVHAESAGVAGHGRSIKEVSKVEGVPVQQPSRWVRRERCAGGWFGAAAAAAKATAPSGPPWEAHWAERSAEVRPWDARRPLQRHAAAAS